MKILLNIILFHSKLTLVTLPISLALGLLGVNIGMMYVFITPIYHFTMYHVINPNDYLYYNNFGLSKMNLWITTIVISLLICIIINLI